MSLHLDRFLSRPLVAIALSLVALGGVAACGSDDEGATGGASTTSSSASVDRAFVREMVPHHEGAIDMAQVALDRSKRPEIRRLARAIVATQRTEISTLRSIDRRLAAEGAKTGSLGMSHSDMGMGDTAMLRTADPFDRAFIDMMVPHHEGALKMAKVQLERGADEPTKRLARQIVSAQQQEIAQMQGWREQWYGEASAKGAAPVGDGHGGHS